MAFVKEENVIDELACAQNSNMNSQEASATQPCSQSSSDLVHSPPPIPEGAWGFLTSHNYDLPKIYYLTKKSHTFGRSPKEDFTFNLERHCLPLDVYSNISKHHFVIHRNQNESNFILEDRSLNGTFINKQRVGGNDSGEKDRNPTRSRMAILQDHDKISICDASGPFFIFSLLGNVNELEKGLPQDLLQKYRITNLLGTGGSATVYLAYEHVTCQPFAVKRIDKDFKTMGMNSVSYIQTEIKILKSLAHPNIVRVQDVIDVEHQTFIVMEYMKGGSLAKVLQQNKSAPLEEKLCQVWFYQLLLSLEYLNSKSIIHRDIKLENILVSHNSRDSPIKLADFGLSKIVSQSKKAVTCCGSYEYVAPEVINSERLLGFARPYTSKVDIWSLGVTLFVCLSGKMPFISSDAVELKKKILAGNINMKGPEWAKVSEHAKQMVRCMLMVNPEERKSAAELLEAPWFQTKKFDIVKEACKRFSKTSSKPPPLFDSQNEEPAPKVARIDDADRHLTEKISPQPSTSKCIAF
ncbi:ovarian-specific serine/threonine-protein kinase Lok-like [Neocloeon triangulifer]|uniref:ovarian-specific serine/threonine-protein kinase Lok-like n=1 Tax=Neocloeon triangulifer TaxID=2078957 RepID=UPI00286EDCCB|nr:ovarian-specific serine/threonine-protein kinase Lok-like [Neocloeon triangulifer]XP_059483258.1 ovarian-specific serine/threonine-protein kinase Lok-like [Neocloeon triangulifer]XP_059483259.1 ovarian-specific serine/threonine-protein kinase Lok-like [Neocloeon triangulifer]XP_059483260.1 ovarian-specific serine/threonine-protein kinase Lok-like [Neocloeon triangulifer]